MPQELMRSPKFLKRAVLILLSILTVATITIVAIYIAILPPSLPVPQQKDWVLSNVTIWNPGHDTIEQQTLSVSDGLIAALEPSQPDEPVSICDGCFAVPGLIDAHIHSPPKLAIGNQELFSLLYLNHGVTTVRDLGQFDDGLPELASKLNAGQLVGPRMYRCGRILDGDPPGVPGAIEVLTFEQGKENVEKLAGEGVDCIKVYGNLSASAFNGVAEKANEMDLPLIGHTPNALSFNEIENFESQHYTGIPYLNKPAPKGWAYKSQDLIDMAQPDIDEVVATMKTNNISFLPTNANGMARLIVSDIERFPPTKGFAYLPEFWQVAWPSIISHPETEAAIQTELEALPASLSFIAAAHKGGVDVLVGTDVVMPYVIPGEAMLLQLELMAEALGSNEAALNAATEINGQHIDRGKIGVIKIGAYADLLLFKTDPRGDLSNVQNWDYAMVGGRLYSRQEIDEAVNAYEKHFRGRLYSTVLNLAYGFMAGEYEDSEVAKH
jgi:hypothetical protein